MIQNSWVRCLKPKPFAQIRLFCFPYAGGGSSIYRTWGKDLPDEIEVYAIQLPGRENRIREKPFTDLNALIQALTPMIEPYLDKPFAVLLFV